MCRYSLVASASLVSIEFTNGVITLISPLDFTTSSGFTVDVRCEDLGNSPLQDISAVTVSVSPVIAFEQTVYTAELAENSGVGTFIQKVSQYYYHCVPVNTSISYFIGISLSNLTLVQLSLIFTLVRPNQWCFRYRQCHRYFNSRQIPSYWR